MGALTMERVGFLGPHGTFSEQALLSRPEAQGAQSVPYRSVDGALTALRGGQIDAAIVPIENSVEGGVPATLDALAQGSSLVVVAETLLPVSFVLAARPGVGLDQVTMIGTHPHAWAQIRGWASEHAPHAGFVPTASTAASAVDLGSSAQTGYDASVCLDLAAAQNGLTVLATDIGDNSEAVTRFVLVARPGFLPEPTGHDKTTLTLYQHLDRPGALLELLEQFKARGINLIRLESRPTGESLGRYCFSVDLEGHLLEERVGEALAGLKRTCLDVRFLGSYPRADEVRRQIPDGYDDFAYQSAAQWLSSIRGGRSPIRVVGAGG